jgi:4-aminobutyrate aminotransferase-like enzyme
MVRLLALVACGTRRIIDVTFGSTSVGETTSRELLNRRAATVAAGVGVGGTVLPVFVDSATGGVLRDVDGNSLIGLGSGIAAPASVTRRRR